MKDNKTMASEAAGMDRRHKILLNVVVIVLIFAPLFFVLRHREWLSLYMNALSLFIILYMCWGFFRIACARIAETDQPWKKVLVGLWCLAMAVLLSANHLLDFFTGWSWFAAIGGSVVVALIVGRDET